MSDYGEQYCYIFIFTKNKIIEVANDPGNTFIADIGIYTKINIPAGGKNIINK